MGLLLLLLVGAVRADAAFDAFYKAMADGWNAHDAQAIFAVTTDDYTYTVGEHVLTRAQILAATDQLFPLAASMRIEVVSVQPTGDTMQVTTHQHLSMRVRDVNGVIHDVVHHDTVVDTWTRAGEQWRLKTTVVQQRVRSVDGQEGAPFPRVE